MTWLLLASYLAGWLVTAPLLMRWIADHIGRCHHPRSPDFTHGYCRISHPATCWTTDGRIEGREVACGLAITLIWPALIPVALTHWIATRKPTPVALQRRIEELEHELGLEHK